MKAFLLAAGLGTRLRPLTNNIPKCMVPISGKPLFHWWFSLLSKHGITDVLINLHHLKENIIDYVGNLGAKVEGLNFELKTSPLRRRMQRIHKEYTLPNIALFYEQELLGSAGTIRANADWTQGEKEFLIAYADNLTNANLTKLFHFHQKCNPILTMGLFHSDYPQACGIASLNENGLVVDFVEKPQKPQSDLANAGIYVASPSLIDYIPEGKVVDLGHDVLPSLVGKIYGCVIDGYLRDIGTSENYRKAQREWREIQTDTDAGIKMVKCQIHKT